MIDQSSEEDVALERRQATVEVNGRRFEVNLLVPDSKTKPPRRSTSGLSSSGSGSGQVVAPMQGTIVNVLVEESSKIEAGDPICVLEAMKMEMPISATTSGTLTKIYVSPGDQVAAGDTLALIS